MSYTTTAVIDLAALSYNLQRVKSYAPKAKVLAMVKANAYGHGLVAIAKALSAADALGVARIQEALVLREAGITAPIMLMEGFFQAWELPLLAQHQLISVIHSDYQLQLLAQEQSRQLPIWLKVNTGMNRLGFPTKQINDVYQQAKAISQVIGVMTHFACADEIDNPFTVKQINEFNRVTKAMPIAKSLANSAGIIAWPDSQADWVRPGLMLYGVSPIAGKVASDFNLKPVMNLTAQLIAINQCAKGEKVGYNGIYECPEDMLVGIASIGYGDGYPRYLREPTPALVKESKTQVIGRISMDMIAVDLRPIAHQASIGDPVLFWGEGLPIERIANAASTSPYELLAGLTGRVVYRYL